MPTFTPAEYLRREKVAATGLTIAFIGWVVGNVASQQSRGARGEGPGGALAAISVVQILAILVGVGTWLYARPARREWAALMRVQAAAPGALEPLGPAERAVLLRALKRRRWAGWFVLGTAALLVLVGVGFAGLLGGAGRSSGPTGGVVVAVGVCLVAAAGLAWAGQRIRRSANVLVGRAESAELLGMRLRGPLVARQLFAPPRFGGLPLLVLDQQWNRALRTAGGEEVELLVAPTFADDPKVDAPRVLVRGAGG